MTKNAQVLPVDASGHVRRRTARRLADFRVDLLLVAIGSWLHILAYGSAQPLVVAALFWIAGTSVLWLARIYLWPERTMFDRQFLIGWLMAGVSAVYANLLGDPLQLDSDAATFFLLAQGESVTLGLEGIRQITEGAGAVALWRSAYDAFAYLGFEKGRYIGVLINVTSIALAGVVALRMARLVYGPGVDRLRRLIMIFSWCGLMWLFAGIHLRDSMVFLVVTVNSLLWVRYLVSPGASRLGFLAMFSILLFGVFAYLRSEFVFVPIAMFFAALGSSIVTYSPSSRARQGFIYASYLIALGITWWLYVEVFEDVLFALGRGSEVYSELVAVESSADSLGMSLIVNQPLPIRVFLGSVYLFVFPIPFWSGLQLESVAPVFKSFNALFFYAFTPLLLMSLVRIWSSAAQRTRVNVFLVLVTLGFTLAIAGTSLETRHFGAFLAPAFVLALLPDLKQDIEWRAYKRLFFLFLATVAIGHLAWVALKVIH